MNVRPDFPLLAETILPDLDFAAIKTLMLHEAQAHDLPVIENDDTRVTVETPYGCYRIEAVPGGVAARVTAAKHDLLFTLKEGLVAHLVEYIPDIAANLHWSDADQAGVLPPNFHFATVVSVRPVGTSFQRVRIQAPGLSSFQDDAIHFRLVLPPAGVDKVEWPSVSENGTTVWPKGDKALHRPVYTTRRIDHAQGVMAFDVFRHQGGRVTEWADTVQPGARIAVVGPGGGGIPDTRRILMFIDETALPATARILESLPDDAQGQVTVRAAEGAFCAYPLAAPSGIAITWLAPESSQTLADLALSAHEELPGHFLWFACEKADVQKVRAAYKAKGADPANAYIAAYWTRT